jgi:alanine racemase
MRIDLDALAGNWRRIVAATRPSQPAAVIKADAYGLGAAAVAQRLAEAGCRRFYVAWPHEGAQVRAALGDGVEIGVFNGPTEGAAALIREARLEPVLNSPDQIRLWRSAFADASYSIHIDTGMNRLGLSGGDWIPAAGAAPRPNRLISHLACADDPTHPMNIAQRERFLSGAALWPDCARSLSATGGIALGSAFHFEETRPGIALYGGAPDVAGQPPLETVLYLTSPVLQVRQIQPGDTIGYGCGYEARRPMQVAVVAAGYADGLLRSGSGHASVAFGNELRRILGRISMDLIVVDATGLNIREGDSATLLGESPSLGEQANAMGTIPYELLTRIAPRAIRQYA